MTTKKVLNHSAILKELNINLDEKMKGRNFSNNYSNNGKICSLDKTVKSLIPKRNIFSEKTFSKNNYVSELKEKLFDKKVIPKETNYTKSKIDIKISFNNFQKHNTNKINFISKQKKDSLNYNPSNNKSISKKNDFLESEYISHNNLENKSKIKMNSKNSQNSNNNYTKSFMGNIKNSNNCSFIFKPKSKGNNISTSHPPFKTEANEFKQNDYRPQETSFNNTYDNFNKDILQTETCNKHSNNNILISISTSKLSALEIQLDSINQSTNKRHENLNEKLNVCKNSLDQVIKLASPEISKLLDAIQKIIEKLNTKTKELDILTMKYTSCIKALEDRQEEIKFLNWKLNDNFEKTTSQTKINKGESKNKENNNGKSIEILNNHNEIISNMNKINIDDLEAIYFIDKVQMRSNSVPENKIPKLDFNVFQQQEDRRISNIEQVKNYEDSKKPQLKKKIKQINDKQSISPLKNIINEQSKLKDIFREKKLTINNIHDTSMQNDNLVKISNYTSKNLHFNYFGNKSNL